MVLLKDLVADFNTKQHEELTHLIVIVELPTGNREAIINTSNIPEKVAYYVQAYDDNFALKTNNRVRIVDYILV